MGGTLNTRGRQILGFLRENKLPLGGNTLGLVLGEISRVRSWKRKTLEEEQEGSFNAKFVFSLPFSSFLSFDGCIYFSPYVLVSFFRF